MQACNLIHFWPNITVAHTMILFQEGDNTWNSNTSISINRRSCKHMLSGHFILMVHMLVTFHSRMFLQEWGKPKENTTWCLCINTANEWILCWNKHCLVCVSLMASHLISGQTNYNITVKMFFLTSLQKICDTEGSNGPYSLLLHASYFMFRTRSIFFRTIYRLQMVLEV